MSQLVINTSFNIELGFELAPIHKRIIAYLLDTFIIVVYLLTVLYAMSSSLSDLFNDDNGLGFVVSFLIACPILFYHLASEVLLNGESVGKKIMGLKVISMDGNSPTLSQYALRWFLRPIDFAFTSNLGGIICTAITKHGQRIGDLAADTTVVSKKLPYSIDNTIFKDVNKEAYHVSYPQVMRLSDRDLNTINNILQQHRKSNMYNYVVTIAEKVKTVLEINTGEEAYNFLETLLSDYNYLSQNK